MERRIGFIIAAISIAMIFFAGCTSYQDASTPAATTTTTQTETATVTPEPTYSVTEPVLVTGEDIYSIKITIDAEETESNTLYVGVHYDSSSSIVSTGVGSELMATIFAYNLDDVPYDFNPITSNDVINAGIPYKRVPSTVYPSNKVNAGAELPTDSVQGGLNTGRPYNYGAIIEKTGTRE